MPTLILKTDGMSAYGLQTFDVTRKINSFPTRSAILGILAASLGLTRDDHNKVFDLSKAVTIAVQVHSTGKKIMDYHTIQNFRSPSGKIQKSTKQSYREYCCDSEYSFAIHATDELLNNIVEAVKYPRFTLFQGRKSCPLTRPLFERVVDESNPVNALIIAGGKGQIFSDIPGPGEISTVQVRDVMTEQPRKYATRLVYVCAPKELRREFAD